MSGGHSRQTIKADIVNSQDTGEPPEVRAIESYTVNTYSLAALAPIPAFQSRTVYLYPAVGVVYQVKSLYMKALAPGVLGAGVHSIAVHSCNGFQVLEGASVYNNPIEYNYRYWYSATQAQQPTLETSQGLAIDSLIGSLDCPIYFVYANNTNIQQNADVVYRVATKEAVY